MSRLFPGRGHIFRKVFRYRGVGLEARDRSTISSPFPHRPCAGGEEMAKLFLRHPFGYPWWLSNAKPHCVAAWGTASPCPSQPSAFPPPVVIPAKAGILGHRPRGKNRVTVLATMAVVIRSSSVRWIPAFAGLTDFAPGGRMGTLINREAVQQQSPGSPRSGAPWVSMRAIPRTL